MTIKQQGGIFGRNPTFNDVTIDGQLTFDGDIDVNSDLKVDGNLDVTGTGDFGGKVKVTEAGNGEVEVERISGALINLQAQSARGVIGTNSNHELQLKSNSTGRLKITTAGNVEVMSGNLVIGTSGKGIDFSATSGTGTSELFDDYEEGTWTPVVTSSVGTLGTNSATGNYTKVGNVVSVNYNILITSNGTGSGSIIVNGLPFTQSAFRSGGVGFETDVVGFAIVSNGITSSTLVYITKVDGTYPAGNSYRLQGSFVYQV
jgi:hypothetical protein